MTELSCWNCGTVQNDIPRPISRHANCPACFSELHCCRLCIYFDPSVATGQCNEERADPPVIKEGANFCDWFQPRGAAHSQDVTDKHDDALARLDALFDAQPPTQNSDQATEKRSQVPARKEAQARADLDRLFTANNSTPERANGNPSEDDER
jgi:hypothetical protein